MIEGGLASARDSGRGVCIFLEGSAGIGKSSLLAYACHEAAGADFLTLDARGSLLEREFAFGMARGLLAPLLPRLSADDVAAVGAIPLDMGAEGSLARSVLELHHLVLRAADDSPVLVAADDIHWSDEPSLRFLAYLARRISDAPVVLLAAARPVGEWDAPTLRASLLSDAGVRPVRPHALSVQAVAELIAGATATPVEPAFATACRRVTGGNPFYLNELVRTMADRELEPVTASISDVASLGPDGVAVSVEERLGRLGATAAHLARGVSVMGEPCPPAWAAALLGLGIQRVQDAADALRSVSVLTEAAELSFVHPILRTTVYESVPAGTRAAMHARCAEIAWDNHAPDDVVAAHLLRAQAPTAPWAVEVLGRAAGQASRRGAPAAAVTYLRRALEEPLTTADRGRVLVDLGGAEALLRDPQATEHLTEALASAADADDRLAAALMLWSTESFNGQSAEGLEMLRSALVQAAGAGPGLTERVELELARATRSLWTTAQEGRNRIADFLRRPAVTASPLRRVAIGLAAYDAMLTNEPAARVLAMVEQVLPLDDAILGRSESQLLHLPLYTLVYCDAYDRLGEVLHQIEVGAHRRGGAIGSVVADLWGTLAAVRCGELTRAETLGAKALAGAIEQGWLFGRAASQMLLAEVALERGDIRSTTSFSESIQAALQAAPGLDEKGWADHILHGRALGWWAAGDTTRALALLREVGRRHDAWEARCPSELPWRSNAALCAHQLGDHSTAASLADEELDLALAFGAKRALGIALRVHGVVRGSEESLGQAVETLAGSLARLEHARALADLGSWLRSRDRLREARPILRQALALVEEFGAIPVARRVRSELRAAGGRPPAHTDRGPNVLSSPEVKTANLAGLGMSNPEIAAALGISRRTVETHLYNAFKKLGITSRSDLADALKTVTDSDRYSST